MLWLCLTCEFSVKRTKTNTLFWLFTDYHERYLKSSLPEVRNLIHSTLLLLEKTFSSRFILVMSATILCWWCDLEPLVMSSGESHDQSGPNSSSKEVLKTTPPRCDGTFFRLSRRPECQVVHRTSDVFQRTADTGRHHFVSSRKAASTHKCVRKEVDRVNDPCLFFFLHACPLVDRTTHCSATMSPQKLEADAPTLH